MPNSAGASSRVKMTTLTRPNAAENTFAAKLIAVCPSSMRQATRCSGSANRLSTERMSGTGVPENEAAENAT